MHRTQAPYGRRLVNFHRDHGIPPRDNSIAPVTTTQLAVVPRTRASKRGRLHPLLTVFVVVTVLGLLLAMEHVLEVVR